MLNVTDFIHQVVCTFMNWVELCMKDSGVLFNMKIKNAEVLVEYILEHINIVMVGDWKTYQPNNKELIFSR